jgi:hypothetical protein
MKADLLHADLFFCRYRAKQLYSDHKKNKKCRLLIQLVQLT